MTAPRYLPVILATLALLPLAAQAQMSTPQTPTQSLPVPGPETASHTPPAMTPARRPPPPLPPLDPANPYSAKITAAAHVLAAQVTDAQANALAQVRVNDGMIGAVDMAARDVHTAVDSCDQHNPDLKVALDHHFADWHKTVDPVLTLQRKELTGVINAGLAGPAKQVNDYLDLVDKSAAFADQRIEKHPAASDEACTGLLASMDRTKGALAKALMSMQWPTRPPPDAAPAAAAPAIPAPASK